MKAIHSFGVAVSSGAQPVDVAGGFKGLKACNRHGAPERTGAATELIIAAIRIINPLAGPEDRVLPYDMQHESDSPRSTEEYNEELYIKLLAYLTSGSIKNEAYHRARELASNTITASDAKYKDRAHTLAVYKYGGGDETHKNCVLKVLSWVRAERLRHMKRITHELVTIKESVDEYSFIRRRAPDFLARGDKLTSKDFSLLKKSFANICVPSIAEITLNGETSYFNIPGDHPFERLKANFRFFMKWSIDLQFLFQNAVTKKLITNDDELKSCIPSDQNTPTTIYACLIPPKITDEILTRLVAKLHVLTTLEADSAMMTLSTAIKCEFPETHSMMFKYVVVMYNAFDKSKFRVSTPPPLGDSDSDTEEQEEQEEEEEEEEEEKTKELHPTIHGFHVWVLGPWTCSSCSKDNDGVDHVDECEFCKKERTPHKKISGAECKQIVKQDKLKKQSKKRKETEPSLSKEKDKEPSLMVDSDDEVELPTPTIRVPFSNPDATVSTSSKPTNEGIKVLFCKGVDQMIEYIKNNPRPMTPPPRTPSPSVVNLTHTKDQKDSADTVYVEKKVESSDVVDISPLKLAQTEAEACKAEAATLRIQLKQAEEEAKAAHADLEAIAKVNDKTTVTIAESNAVLQKCQRQLKELKTEQAETKKQLKASLDDCKKREKEYEAAIKLQSTSFKADIAKHLDLRRKSDNLLVEARDSVKAQTEYAIALTKERDEAQAQLKSDAKRVGDIIKDRDVYNKHLLAITKERDVISNRIIEVTRERDVCSAKTVADAKLIAELHRMCNARTAEIQILKSTSDPHLIAELTRERNDNALAHSKAEIELRDCKKQIDYLRGQHLEGVCVCVCVCSFFINVELVDLGQITTQITAAQHALRIEVDRRAIAIERKKHQEEKEKLMQELEKAKAEASAKLEADAKKKSTDEKLCTVCMDRPPNATFAFRGEVCGHVYCLHCAKALHTSKKIDERRCPSCRIKIDKVITLFG